MQESDAGLSFGAAAAAYERGRPEWPEELLDALPLGPDAEVLDLGAGTGKLTRVLARRYGHVVAVEPDDAMRALIPGEALAGTAEAIPLADGSVDAVFAAEAFHWFDLDRALPEIRRVLRPAGIVALLWNRFDRSTDVFGPDVLPPHPRGRKQRLLEHGDWERALGRQVRTAKVDVERDVPRAELVDYFASISPITSLPPAERREATARVEAALDRPSYRRRWTATLTWTTLA